jgi:hypothetical protein
MTPAEEAAFIQLWNAGTESAEIGRQLGIPRGTVSSRASTLAKQGKIQPRPKGGSYPRQQAQGRTASPSQTPVQSRAEQSGAESPPTALVPSPAVASAAIIDLLRQTLARLDTVEQDLKAIRADRHPASAEQSGAVQSGAVQSGAVQSGADLPPLSPEEAKAERWNLWLPRGLRQRIEAVAKARGHAPSKVVQEALWRWVTTEDQR